MSNKFEVINGIVVVLDMLFFAMWLQWSTMESGAKLGIEPADKADLSNGTWLRALEITFLVWYLAEFALRFWALGPCVHLQSKSNILDVLILLMGICEIVFLPFGGAVGFMRMLRLLRLLRVIRLSRLVRLLSSCQDLYIILKTLGSSGYPLLWSMAFAALCIFASSLVLCQLVSLFLQEESQDAETRLWAYKNFGTLSRTGFSMWEATFTTKWAQFNRTMIYDMNGLFSVFWAIYMIFVNFAVVRVISAMFLKQTLLVARAEEERMAAVEIKKRRKTMKTLRQICSAGDVSGDGKITREEFEDMIKRKDVVDILIELDIEVEEAEMLFDLLSEDDGDVEFHEFITGAMKIKGSARTFDTIQILYQLSMLRKLMDTQVTMSQIEGGTAPNASYSVSAPKQPERLLPVLRESL